MGGNGTRRATCVTTGDVGEYAGDVGEYAGDVGKYAGDVGEYAGDVGENAVYAWIGGSIGCVTCVTTGPTHSCRTDVGSRACMAT